ADPIVAARIPSVIENAATKRKRTVKPLTMVAQPPYRVSDATYGFDNGLVSPRLLRYGLRPPADTLRGQRQLSQAALIVIRQV
ncbi:MAG: hypothetical protein ACPGIJ_15665, partial [Mycobacterium sp.]